MCRHAVPAIWLYPEAECDVEVALTFRGNGFMTVSTPPYQDKWRIHVDPSVPFAKYRERYGFQSRHEFLDYDGIREGPYQTTHGWCIDQANFVNWLVKELASLGFNDAETGSVAYYYGRTFLDHRHPEKYLLIYPQETSIVDQSVVLSVTPTPRSVYRIWFYLQLSGQKRSLETPYLQKVERDGFVVTEVGFLTQRDLPSLFASKSENALLHGVLPYWVEKSRI
jgi:hypothetical protein